jgi:cobalt-zinc-cadmium efflux system protein
MATATRKSPDVKLIWAILVNLGVAGVEVVGGFYAGSLSLLSDALHNTSDAFSLFISLVALRLSRRDHTESRTFGYKRAEIMAALLNASILVIVSFFLFKEALERLYHPTAINSHVMMAVASAALVVNTASALLLRRDSRISLNIRASYLHLVTDALCSLAIIAGGACVFFRGWTWVDPLLTLAIGLFVLAQGYHVVTRTIRILMQSAPRGMDLSAIQRCIEELPDIRNIHHVHLWQMTERDIHFEAHVDLSRDMSISEATALKERIEDRLGKSFGIWHATLQLEFEACKDIPLVKPGPHKESFP